MTTSIVPVTRAPLALPTPLTTSVEVEDAFDDDSLEMNTAGDKFRVRRYRFCRRIIGVSETTFNTTSFEPLTACQVPVPARDDNRFYKFRALVIYESSNVSEGMALRMRLADGAVLFGQQRFKISMGDTVSTAIKTRFDDFTTSPAAETAGPGSALGFMELEGGFGVEALSAGNLRIEVACETGTPQWVKIRVGTFLDLVLCS